MSPLRGAGWLRAQVAAARADAQLAQGDTPTTATAPSSSPPCCPRRGYSKAPATDRPAFLQAALVAWELGAWAHPPPPGVSGEQLGLCPAQIPGWSPQPHTLQLGTLSPCHCGDSARTSEAQTGAWLGPSHHNWMWLCHQQARGGHPAPQPGRCFRPQASTGLPASLLDPGLHASAMGQWSPQPLGLGGLAP